MPKAKKKKVAVTETAEIITAIEEEFENTGPTGEEQVAPAPVIEPELAPAESPRRARIKKIGKFVILLAESAEAAQLRATEAEEHIDPPVGHFCGLIRIRWRRVTCQASALEASWRNPRTAPADPFDH